MRQFWAALSAQPPIAERQAARRWLPPSAWHLFCAMPAADQRHSLNVLQALQAQGLQEPDLLAAALLHDVAKAGRLRLWHRVALVLLRLSAPGRRLLRWLAQPTTPGNWRYPFYVIVNHPALGAAQARAAGCSETTVWLIAHHQTPLATPHDRREVWLQALQKVDDAS